MAKILMWLNTYQREDLLLRLLKSIQEQSSGHQVDLFIFKDDGGSDYELIKRSRNIKIFYSHNKRCGKEFYWKLINEGLKYIEKYKDEYDLFIKTDDDMILCPDFFNICLRYWNAISKPKVFSIDILSAPRQRGRDLKGNYLQLMNMNDEVSLYQTQWVDMNFIFNISAFKEIDFKITNCRSSLKTSGVGLWLTHKFNSLGYKMYQSTVSLLIHQDHESKMHGKVRTETPIVTQGLQ